MCIRKFICLILLSINISYVYSQAVTNRVEVAADGHFLQYTNGEPFFWLGDTAWELFHRLNKAEISRYLANRKAKGFNVIQAVLLAEMDGLRVPNRAGNVPFHHLDPQQPNEAYFRLVDTVVQEASEKGLYMALLPTWGDKVTKKWGLGPEIFNEQNAYHYGLFLGKRYGKYPNVLWISGGDRPAIDEGKDYRPIWRALIKGIREGSRPHTTLVTYHPSGESSSTKFWGKEAVLDFNMMQSGHGHKNIPVHQWIVRDYQLNKPVLDGEPCYEDHPIAFNAKNGYFKADDVRRRTYHSVFAGACGVTYGHHAIWQFYNPKVPKVTFVDRYWYEALDRPGAFQMGYLKKLIESRLPKDRVPDTAMVQNNTDSPEGYISALKGQKNEVALIYLPQSKAVDLDLSWMQGRKVKQEWFNPADGKISAVKTSKKNRQMSFHPPHSVKHQDWVLILTSD